MCVCVTGKGECVCVCRGRRSRTHRRRRRAPARPRRSPRPAVSAARGPAPPPAPRRAAPRTHRAAPHQYVSRRPPLSRLRHCPPATGSSASPTMHRTAASHPLAPPRPAPPVRSRAGHGLRTALRGAAPGRLTQGAGGRGVPLRPGWGCALCSRPGPGCRRDMASGTSLPPKMARPSFASSCRGVSGYQRGDMSVRVQMTLTKRLPQFC